GVALTGSVEEGRAISRNGAKPGHVVFLTGLIGLSAGGLHGMLHSRETADVNRAKRKPLPPPAMLVKAHRRPSPSIKAGRLLLESRLGQSLNDVSDGLASEAWEIAEASNVKLVLRESHLPLSGELASYARECGIDPLEWLLYGGEDYVLLGTAEAGNAEEL